MTGGWDHPLVHRWLRSRWEGALYLLTEPDVRPPWYGRVPQTGRWRLCRPCKGVGYIRYVDDRDPSFPLDCGQGVCRYCSGLGIEPVP